MQASTSLQSAADQETMGMIEMRGENERLVEEDKEVRKRDNGQQLNVEMPSHMEIDSDQQPLEIELQGRWPWMPKKQRREDKKAAKRMRRWKKHARTKPNKHNPNPNPNP